MPKLNFEEIAADLSKMVSEKNAAYGDSFINCGKIMQILYPAGISPEQMVDALLVVRIIDKLNRISTRKNAFGESPFVDIFGYGLCGVYKDQPVEDAIVKDEKPHVEMKRYTGKTSAVLLQEAIERTQAGCNRHEQ